MNLHHLRRGFSAIALCSSLFLASCITRQVNRAVADTQASMIVRNDGTLIDGVTGATVSSGAREKALRSLEALRGKFPNDTAIQANLSFRIAMIKSSGGYASDAKAAWSEVAKYSSALSKDQQALFKANDSIVWFFARPAPEEESRETRGNFYDGDQSVAPGHIQSFLAIGNNKSISPELALWGAYHAAIAAYYHGLKTGDGTLFSAPARKMEELHDLHKPTSLDNQIAELRNKNYYKVWSGKKPS